MVVHFAFIFPFYSCCFDWKPEIWFHTAHRRWLHDSPRHQIQWHCKKNCITRNTM